MRRLLAPVTDGFGRRLANSGITANTLTCIGFAIGALAAIAAGTECYLLAAALFLANRALDGLDGAVARCCGPTDRGGYLDISLDFLVYSGFVLGFAVARPSINALPAAFLLFSFIGTSSSFLAFAAIAARRGLRTEIYGPKAIYYLGGLTEGTETILAFLLFCTFPDSFPILACLFAVLCCVTTLSRIYAGWRIFT